MKKKNLKKLLARLNLPDKASEGFKAFDKGIASLKSTLQESIQVATLDEVNSELSKFKRKIDLEPLVGAVEKIKSEFDSKVEQILSLLEEKTQELDLSVRDSVSRTAKDGANRTFILQADIAELRNTLSEIAEGKNKELNELRKQIALASDHSALEDSIIGNAEDIKGELVSLGADLVEIVDGVDKKVDKVKSELQSRINNIPRGGNANRNIAIGGNTSVLSKYTDINIKPGSNVTLTYSNNDTTKYLDLTITSAGGGGSVVGTTRSINSISTSQTAGDTAGTDYVYIATAGVKLTLPTAVSNTNLYTVKNASNSSVLIVADGSETIDDDPTIIMPIKYTSVDLISNDTNWQIT